MYTRQLNETDRSVQFRATRYDVNVTFSSFSNAEGTSSARLISFVSVDLTYAEAEWLRDHLSHALMMHENPELLQNYKRDEESRNG